MFTYVKKKTYLVINFVTVSSVVSYYVIVQLEEKR